MSELTGRQNVLILLLMEVTRRNVSTPFLLLDLIAGQLILQLCNVIGMREGLLAAIGIEVIVCGWGVKMGVERALANTCAIGSASAVVELKRSQLSIVIVDGNSAVAVAVGSVRSCRSEVALIGPNRQLCVWVAVTWDIGILPGSERRSKAADTDGSSMRCNTRILFLLESKST